MEILEFLKNLDVPLSLQEVGNVMLPVTGTLLGLVYTGLIFWLDGGIAKLEHTKSIFEDSLIADGKVLLDLLVGATIVSLFAVIQSRELASLSFWIFGIIFTLDLLKSISEQGYIKALFGSDRIPANLSNFQQFLVRLKITGLVGLVRFFFFATPIIILPLLVNWQTGGLLLSDSSIKLCIIAASLFSLIQVRNLLTQAFDVRKQLDKLSRDKSLEAAVTLKDIEKDDWDKKKIDMENLILQEELERVNIFAEYSIEKLQKKANWTSRDLDPAGSPVLKWQPRPDKSGNFHMNLVVPYLSDDNSTREYIFFWTQCIFTTLAKSNSTIPTMAVSFYRKDEYKEEHLALFRGVKSDILLQIDKIRSSKDFIKSLKGRFIHESIAEI